MLKAAESIDLLCVGMDMIKLIIVVLTYLLLLPSLHAQEPTQPTVKVGVIYGFTGAAKVWSSFGRMGLELAQEEINSTGGVQGKQIELVFEDSQTNPSQSVAAYRKLTNFQGIRVIIGDVWDFITKPLIPLATKDKVVLFSPNVVPDSFDNSSPYFFTMGARVGLTRDAVELFFRSNPDIKRVGIFCWDDPWGEAYHRVWKEVAAANQVVVESSICNSDFSNDYRTEVTKMAAKKVDAVIIAHMAGTILSRMKEQKFHPKVLATSNVVEDLKVNNSPKELFEGVYFTDRVSNEGFLRAFKAKFNQEPVVEAHNSYEALRSIAKAINTGNQDLAGAMSKVKYQGVAGPIDFSRSFAGNQARAKLYKVLDGQFELVR